MHLDRSLSLGVSLLSTLILSLGPIASTAEGQYFGRNKVQYESFDFRVMKTAHYDIYYYPEARVMAEQVGRMAERWYDRFSRLFNHELQARQPIILYADHPDFEQTTALQGQIGEGTGGVTEAFKRRVILPSAGPLGETDHVLGHELVHAFQYDITASTGAPVGGRFPRILGLPQWVADGMAEYFSLGPVHTHTAMWMRDAARRGEVPTVSQLNNPARFNPYRYGHALFAYIGGRWGDQAVAEFLRLAARTGNASQALGATLQISQEQLNADWTESILAAYEELVEETDSPEDYGRLLIGKETGSGRLNIAPALSPDGKQIVFLSEKDQFNIEMFVADAETGEITRKILKTATDPHFESLQFINSAGDWDPSSSRFVFAGVSKGKPIITIVDTDRRKVSQEFTIPEVGEIFNPTWSPDGRYVAFSALIGGMTDLYTLDVESGQRQRLTSDLYADLAPAWSPDGRRIAFVTDRFTSNLENLDIGDYRIGFIDPQTGAIEEAPNLPNSKNINPQWSRDGSSLYFLSDHNGITNIYRTDFPEGEIRQVTNLLVGVSGITDASPALSVAANADRLVFSAYAGDRYNIYVIDEPSVLEGGPVQEPLAEISPAVLPPADRPVGDVMGLIANATLGLPASAAEFDTAKYSAGLSLDYIAPPQVAVGSDRFGTYVGGGTALFWSDILGHHTLSTLLQVNGSFKDIAAVVGYENKKSRWNWGATAGQIPFVTRTFRLVLGGEQEFTFRQINRTATGIIAYPFSRVQRIEFSARYNLISFDNEVETRFLTASGEVASQREDFPPCDEVDPGNFCTPSALNLGTVTGALVYDNTFYGFTGPVLGQRYRFQVAPIFGSLDYVGVLTDFRKYVMPIRPYTLAGRILHFGRYGGDEDNTLLQPLFLGYQPLIRGYNSGSFNGSECQEDIDDDSFVGTGTCPVFDQLFGSKLIATNLELRFPLFGGFRIGRPVGFPPLDLAFFFDAGVTWWDRVPSSRAGNTDPFNAVTSYGAALRLNFFGAALIEIDYVHPNDRPQKGWYWQFSFTPGF